MMNYKNKSGVNESFVNRAVKEGRDTKNLKKMQKRILGSELKLWGLKNEKSNKYGNGKKSN